MVAEERGALLLLLLRRRLQKRDWQMLPLVLSCLAAAVCMSVGRVGCYGGGAPSVINARCFRLLAEMVAREGQGGGVCMRWRGEHLDCAVHHWKRSHMETPSATSGFSQSFSSVF